MTALDTVILPVEEGFYAGYWQSHAAIARRIEVNNTFDENFGGPGPCYEVGNVILEAFYGNAPPATLGDLSTYVGGVLTFSCGTSGCSNPPGIDSPTNWTYVVAPDPGPVSFVTQADADPHPPQTIDAMTGYPVGYTFFDYVTDSYLCGFPESTASTAACEQPAASENGQRVLPWRMKPASLLNRFRTRADAVGLQVHLSW